MDRSYWKTLPRSGTAAEIAEAARRAEAEGFTGVIGTQVYGPPWAMLGVAAAATTTLQVASGIVMGFVRSPFETACAALDLDALAEGRFTLGLGAAPQQWTERYFGMAYLPPIGRMREVVSVIRRVDEAARTGSGAPEAFTGRHYELSYESFVPTFVARSGPLPIWLAALRERLCELAGEVADGLIGHPVWSVDWTLGPALDALARGAARAGRDPDSIHLQLWLTVSLDEDRRRATESAKGNVAFYGGIEQYRPFFAAHGFGAEADRLVEARRSLPLDECARLVPDEMARTFVVCGNRDDVAGVLDRLWRRADSMVVRPATWGVPAAEVARRAAELDALLLS
ncbi:MAG: LLM class flavin-dependent oxidoreductase [Acidimicrobiales bacterium]|nr:LLM class flavin-dependent oxidoreductase [Acidimicrobiales bacterium]